MTKAMEAGYIKIITMYEKKLLELMGKKDYTEFGKKVAKEAFAAEVEQWPEGDLKEFAKDNFEMITEDEE